MFVVIVFPAVDRRAFSLYHPRVIGTFDSQALAEEYLSQDCFVHKPTNDESRFNDDKLIEHWKHVKGERAVIREVEPAI